MQEVGETEFFFELTPSRILESVERNLGVACTGRAIALNSMENRVYEIELDLPQKPRHRWENFLVAKFYRPGRWSLQQLEEEHLFLRRLVADELPVVAPLTLQDGSTLGQIEDTRIYFAVFQKAPGRSPAELTGDELKRVGRTIARIHNVGATIDASHRISLNPTTYGTEKLRYLNEHNLLPREIGVEYGELVTRICQLSESRFAGVSCQLIHGDCHLGNILWDAAGPFWVDFDDALIGPPVQDLWLVVGGRDRAARESMRSLLEGYLQMRNFDMDSLALIETLRALRMIHFATWIGARWADPAFQRAFPDFGSFRYWQQQLIDLREQVQLVDQNIWDLTK